MTYWYMPPLKTSFSPIRSLFTSPLAGVWRGNACVIVCAGVAHKTDHCLSHKVIIKHYVFTPKTLHTKGHSSRCMRARVATATDQSGNLFPKLTLAVFWILIIEVSKFKLIIVPALWLHLSFQEEIFRVQFCLKKKNTNEKYFNLKHNLQMQS